jgi:hypothetical protein
MSPARRIRRTLLLTDRREIATIRVLMGTPLRSWAMRKFGRTADQYQRYGRSLQETTQVGGLTRRPGGRVRHYGKVFSTRAEKEKPQVFDLGLLQ